MPVVNTSDSQPTGNQNLGTITVGTSPSNIVSDPTGVKYYADDRVVGTVATASGLVDGRFDDPRYYTGDAAT